ncbi:hypothetical protein [Pseudomonas citronellolis]|uniref:hypothetical protein n=1 Tax=Pseudomonas citronellolis TaxID=53408 RepID=UPI00209D37D9|nr:hypothetical protein [Pseudomonas citronellolis]MCP1605737.1 hypothetical protein [Pseudomonas citronellolis]MCP1656108.1 hypothetical protein [Pseudomonas citronellolis]MCP1722268.1 hypothetical protein [Pseudomonas citronellolis]
MKDWLEVFRDHINERLSNPWISAYSVSWAVINYKFFIIIFSKLTPLEKIAYIQGNLYGDIFGQIHYFFTPLVMAFLYIYVLPFPARWAIKFTLQQNNINRKARQQAEEETLLSEADAKALRASIRDTVKSLEDEVRDLTTRVKVHKEEAEQYETELSEVKAELQSSEATLEKFRKTEASLRKHIEIITPSAEENNRIKEAFIERGDELRHLAGILKDLINSSANFNMIHPSSYNYIANFIERANSGEYTFDGGSNKKIKENEKRA